MKRFALLTVISCALAARSGSPPSAAVTAVRHWSQPEVTRIAVEVSGEFHYRSDRLHNPERIYFDIVNARNGLGTRYYAEDISDAVVKRIRVAEANPGTTRVVIDLTGDARVNTTQLANPGRLIIELRASGAPAQNPATPTRLYVPEPSPRNPDAPKPGLTVRADLQVTPTQAAPVPDALKPMPPVTPLPNPPTVAKAAATAPPMLSGPAPVKAAPPSVAALNPPVSAKTIVPPAATASISVNPPLSPRTAAPAPAAAAPVKTTETAAISRDATRSEDTSAAEVGKAARRTASGETSLVRALGLKLNRVVIDPGHGGHDQGTAGVRGLLEKDLVLDIALRVGALIEERLRAEVVYTRSTDVFIPLEARTALANEKKADLFLSIHANASAYPKVSGVETYYLNFTESKDALAVASRENASAMESISELHDLIQKITLHDKAEESRDLAGNIQSTLFTLYSRGFPAEPNRGVRRAPFVVLIGASMPSVLAEVGFLTNAKEEALLRKSEYRQKVAEALERGLERYASGLSHFQVAQNK